MILSGRGVKAGGTLVADDASGAEHAADATLLNMVRAGDSSAFGTLYQRHEPAARRLATHLVARAEVDDVVSETFARVFYVTRRGGGPTDAFRPYLLTAVRRVSYDPLRSQQAHVPLAEQQLPDPGEPFIDPAVASLDSSLIARAFRSLPERWSAVLWHTEIEEASPAEVAPIFGLSRYGVAALRARATEGLQQAYLQMHISSVARQECRPVAERLGAFVRNGLSRRDTAAVAEHLSGCDDCSLVCAELTDVNLALQDLVAPLYLGGAAAAYLSGGGHAIAGGAATSAAVGRHAAAAAVGVGHVPAAAVGHVPAAAGAHAGAAGTSAGLGLLGLPPGSRAGIASGGASREAWRPVRWLRHASRQQRVLAAGAGVVIFAAAIGAWAVTLTGNGTPTTPAAQPAAAGSMSSPTPATAASPAQSPSPTQPVAVPVAPASTAPAAPPAGEHRRHHRHRRRSAGAGPTASPPPVKLAATINLYGSWPPWNVAEVVFTVRATNSTPTGDLAAAIRLPSGASLLGGSSAAGDPAAGHPAAAHPAAGDPAGSGPQPSDSPSEGWSCQATATGATCQHPPIDPGTVAQGVVFIGVSQSACGSTVALTAASGAASVSAQSTQVIACSTGTKGPQFSAAEPAAQPRSALDLPLSLAFWRDG